MRSKDFDGMVCPIAGVMAAIGDRWGLLILRDLVCGLSRYDDFRQSSGVTNATLSDRLKHLEANRLIERRRYQVNPERFEYVLTQKGRQIASVMPVLAQIGDRCGVSGSSLPPLKFVNRKTGADVGLAFDGDADRCFLVDDLGVPVSGSATTALVAAAMLDKHPGATILHNLICSKAVPEIIRERGGTPVRTRVGHSYIKAIMAETDAVFGGEHSGHYYFRDNYRADSGSIAALIVLEVLSRAGRPLSQVRTDFERYADSGEINTEVSDPAAVIERVAMHYSGAHQDRLDGLTVDLGEWWFNLRPSNTEPLLRLNLEAANSDLCSERTEEVLSLIRSGRQ